MLKVLPKTSVQKDYKHLLSLTRQTSVYQCFNPIVSANESPIQMLMGHRSIITTERYIKTVDQNLLDASARITLKRSSLNSGNPPTAT